LKSDGSNYAVWQIKTAAALRFVGISSTGEDIKPALNQIGIDLLIDSVDNVLLQHVVPPGPTISVFAVLQQFESMFGKSNESFHAELISSLWTLKQLPGEGIQAYSSRSSTIHDKLVRSGGVFPSDVFLQCFERGLLEVYNMTIRLLHVNPARATFSCLLGELLAEEARLRHQHGLHGGQVPGMAGALAETPRRWQQAKGGGAPAARNSSAGNPNCWNCNKAGHASKDCPEPPVRPWKYAPEGFKHKPLRAAGGAAAAKPAAGPVV
jgi:hypothetical protein